MEGGEWQRHQAARLAHHLSVGPSRCLSTLSHFLPAPRRPCASFCVSVENLQEFCVFNTVCD